ncbi:nucleoside 2-deoxyribosyltransferase [Paraburkholderia strydomiana]|uniref:nucleoside 2-deoxyribosyltransferase n=1 Tax=Paraburkholderia strydomiana TaxID=1245417 RepID=UPI00333D725E
MSFAQHDVVRARIYLAGFDVFRVDALDYGRSLRRMCADAGFEGLYPLGALAPADLSPQEKACVDLPLQSGSDPPRGHCHGQRGRFSRRGRA